MIESDTIKLLRECDAGAKMGVTSIDEVYEHAQDARLRTVLEECRHAHMDLVEKIGALLDEYGDEGKEPPMVAKGMSWLKTNVMLGMKDSDKTVADLMTEGCNMGVKSLNRYLNEYDAAEEKSKDVAKKLIKLEDQLVQYLRDFL